ESGHNCAQYTRPSVLAVARESRQPLQYHAVPRSGGIEEWVGSAHAPKRVTKHVPHIKQNAEVVSSQDKVAARSDYRSVANDLSLAHHNAEARQRRWGYVG